jgi:transient receptor potential cation channel subfamily M protein 2
MMILLVFLLAYGVSSLSLMYPVRDFYSQVFKDITYFPYWQIYGELFLEELEGQFSPEVDHHINALLINYQEERMIA